MTTYFNFKKYDDLEDDEWALESNGESHYSSASSVTSWEEQKLLTASLARGGQGVRRERNVKKEGFEGLNAWRTEHGLKTITYRAYVQSRMNVLYNREHKTRRTVDPGRIDRMLLIRPGLSKNLDDILNDYKKSAVVAPFIDFNLKQPNEVFWIGDEMYTTYVARQVMAREDVKFKKQRERSLLKQKKLELAQHKARYAKSAIGVPVVVNVKWSQGPGNGGKHVAIHEIQSSLNGNNGEWTNGDDLPATLKGKKNKKSRSVSTVSTVKTVETLELKPEEVLFQCTPSYGYNVYFDGDQYTSNPRNPELLVEEGTQLDNVIREGCGYCYIFPGKGKTHSMRPVLFKVVIPAYIHQQTHRHFPAEEIIAIVVLYQFLKNMIGGAIPSESLRNAALSWSDRNLPPEMTDLVDIATQTPRAYIAKMAYILATEAPMIACLTDGVRPLNEEGSSNFSNMDVQANRTNWCLQDHQFLDVGYKRRTDFHIVKFSKDLEPKILRDKDRDESTVWVCDYFEADEATKFQTAYLRFEGLNVNPFIEYGNTAVNMMGGLKRILGARDFEEYYRYNAKKLGQALYNVLLSPREVFYVYSSYIKDIYKVINTRKYPTLQPESPGSDLYQVVVSGLCKWVSTQVSILLAKNSRSTIQYFVDRTHTATNWAYYATYYSYLTLVEPLQSRECNANIPHVKRQLRTSYVKNERVHSDDRIMTNATLEANVKREWAKPGKAPRLFVSYGSGCMYANEIPEFGKICIDGYHYFREGKFDLTLYIMAKPRDGVLDTIFEGLFSALYRDNSVYCAIYSDDQVYGGCINGVPFCFNVDISSNDSSQDLPAFLAVGTALAHFNPNRALGLLSQCTKPIRVSNPKKKSQYFDLKMEGPFEGSGTVLTTLLNHYASSMGALASFYTLAKTSLSMAECIEYGFAQIGHKVTIQSCDRDGMFCFEKVQFLKHSPMRSVSGQWLAVKNYGCIFRSLGVTWDSLTYVSLGVPQEKFLVLSDDERLDKMCGDVVAGLCHEPSSIIMDALRGRFPNGKRVIGTTLYDDLHPGESQQTHTISIESLCARYDVTENDLMELATYIHAARAGCTIKTFAMARFFVVDYEATYVTGYGVI